MVEDSDERDALAPARSPWLEPWLRFGLAVGAYGLALAILYRCPPLVQVFEPLDHPTAWATATILGWLGTDVECVSDVLSHPGGFSFEIYFRCTGLFVAVLLVVGMLALQGSPRRKLIGSLLGVALVIMLNFVRLVSLFLIGVWFPAAFEFVHAVVWESAMLAFVLMYWLVWLAIPTWNRRRRKLRSWIDRSHPASC